MSDETLRSVIERRRELFFIMMRRNSWEVISYEMKRCHCGTHGTLELIADKGDERVFMIIKFSGHLDEPCDVAIVEKEFEILPDEFEALYEKAQVRRQLEQIDDPRRKNAGLN